MFRRQTLWNSGVLCTQYLYYKCIRRKNKSTSDNVSFSLELLWVDTSSAPPARLSALDPICFSSLDRRCCVAVDVYGAIKSLRPPETSCNRSPRTTRGSNRSLRCGLHVYSPPRAKRLTVVPRRPSRGDAFFFPVASPDFRPPTPVRPRTSFINNAHDKKKYLYI